MDRGHLGGANRLPEITILLLRHRAIQIIVASFAVARGGERDLAIDGVRGDDRRDGIVEVEKIRGGGSRAFCAGVEVNDHLGETMPKMMREFERLFRLLRSLGKPSIAVVNGMALGGGFELVAGCDMAVASEKAGIIKDGVPILTGVDQPAAFQVIERICNEKRAPLYRLGRDFSFHRKGFNNFSYNGINESFDLLTLNLRGGHQFQNASLAVAAVEMLKNKGFLIPPEALIDGLGKVSWPGRLETISQSPMIILDGAHNPAGAEMLSRAIKEELEFNRLYLVLGIMADKEVEGIISPLAPLAHEIILSRPKYERASNPSDLLPLTRRYNVNCTAFNDLREAIDYAKSRAGNEDLIIISGSLFTVGEARGILTGQ